MTTFLTVFLIAIAISTLFLRYGMGETNVVSAIGISTFFVTIVFLVAFPFIAQIWDRQAKNCATIVEQERLLRSVEDQIAEWERLTSKAQANASESLPSGLLALVNRDRPVESAVESYRALLKRRAKIRDEIARAYISYRSLRTSPSTSWLVSGVECQRVSGVVEEKGK